MYKVIVKCIFFIVVEHVPSKFNIWNISGNRVDKIIFSFKVKGCDIIIM